MKYLTLALLTLVSTHHSYAIDEDRAKEQWKQYREELNKLLVINKPVPGYRSVVPMQESCSILGCKNVCVSSTGAEIDKAECDKLSELLRTLQPVKDLGQQLKGEGCTGVLTENKIADCKSLVKKQKVHNEEMLEKLKEHGSLPKNTVEDVLSKYESKLTSNLDAVTSFESKSLNWPTLKTLNI